MYKLVQQLKMAEDDGFQEIVIPVYVAKAIYEFVQYVEYNEELSKTAEGYLDTLLCK